VCLAHKTDGFRIVHQLMNRFHEFIAEILDLFGEVANQIMPFQVLPQALDWVEVGAVGGQVNRLNVMPAQALGHVPAGVVVHE
jgi:hypothetical protein